MIIEVQLLTITIIGGDGGIVGDLSSQQTATIKECNNNGKVESKGFAGGFIAKCTKGALTIEKCTNNADIVSSKNAAGILQHSGGNVSITDCTNNGNISIIKSQESSSSDSYAGGIIAEYGSSNCTMTSVKNTGDITAKALNGQEIINAYLGGLVGKGTCQVTSSTNTGNISSDPIKTTCYLGGLIGKADSSKFYSSENHGSVKATSYATSSYFGGIVGEGSSDSLFSDCKNHGAINGEVVKKAGSSDFYTAYVGGLAGCLWGGSFENCSNDANIEGKSMGQADVGGIVGYGNRTKVTKSSNSGNIKAISDAVYADGIIGYAYEETIEESENTGEVIKEAYTN